MRHIKFVSREIAIKLKDLGFNEDCSHRYNIYTVTRINKLPKSASQSLKKQIANMIGTREVLVRNSDLENNESLRYFNDTSRSSYTMTEMTHVAAPVIEHAINWLRTDNNIHLVAIPEPDGYWYTQIYQTVSGYRRVGATSRNYYEALETELSHILDILLETTD